MATWCFFHAQNRLSGIADDKERAESTGLNRVTNDSQTKAERMAPMKKDEFIKLGLDEELAAKCETASLEELKGYIPKSRFDEINETKKALQATIDDLQAKLTDAQKSSGDTASLQATIDDLQAKLETAQQKAAEQAKRYALKEALTKAGVIDPDYLIFKVGGVEQFSFTENGEPEKLEDTLQPFRENQTMAHLFQKTAGYTPKGGTSPQPDNPFTKESYNLTKQGELFRKNPQRARELAKIAGAKIE